jgi:hypothetical protein
MFPFGPKNKIYLLSNPCVPAGTSTGTVYSIRESNDTTTTSTRYEYCSSESTLFTVENCMAMASTSTGIYRYM